MTTKTNPKTERRPGQHENETAMEYLRRVVSNVSYEPESMLDDLPSVQAILEYFELFHTYGTDFYEGIREGIEEGESPKAWDDFVQRWGLNWWTSSSDQG